MKEIISKSFI